MSEKALFEEIFEYSVGADHPSLAGHFPGNPVVPGALALGEILARLQPLLDRQSVAGIQKLKFLRMMQPGEVVEVRCAAKDTRLQIKCVDRVTGQVSLDAQMTLSSPQVDTREKM